jgi:hypothetical protein
MPKKIYNIGNWINVIKFFWHNLHHIFPDDFDLGNLNLAPRFFVKNHLTDRHFGRLALDRQKFVQHAFD